jgi:flagellar protein FlaF
MNGYNAYVAAMNNTEDPRSTEYRLLGSVTGALIRANTAEASLQDRLNALLWNQQVWEAFLVDLSDEDNALPQKLRASLTNLSLWIIKETDALMDNGDDLEAMILINRNIMEGLRPSMSAAAE